MRTAEVRLEQLTAKGSDLDHAAMVAARAFYHDPFFEYLEPRPVLRSRALAIFWKSTIASAAATGQMTGARQEDGRLMGVSLWVPPGGYPFSVAAQAKAMLGAFRGMAPRPRALVDGLRYIAAIETAHPKDRIWYLLLLVVDPAAQRSGIGTRLQNEVLPLADREGLDCYLETQKPENVPYYRRFGYEVDRELRPVKDGPPLWTMRRPSSG